MTEEFAHMDDAPSTQTVPPKLDAPPTHDAPPAPEIDPSLSARFTVEDALFVEFGRWSGYAQLRCRVCGWENLDATGDKAEMRAHVRTHLPDAPLIYGPDGNPLP